MLMSWLILFSLYGLRTKAHLLKAAPVTTAARVFMLKSGATTVPQKKGPSSVWTTETTVVRPPKPGHPRPKVIRARLLTLEYRVGKKAENGKPVETSSTAIFQNGDLLQIKIKVNQDGYLHIIHNREGTDGEVLFPDSRINNGNHFVNKNQELIIPSYCTREAMDEQGNCWFEIFDRPGNEVFTLIFSREARPDVLNQISVVGGTVKLDDIRKIKSSPNQITSRPNVSRQQGGGAGGYAIWVTNTDRKNNEELIEKIVLNHK